VNGSKFLVKTGETGLTGNIYTGLHEFPDMGFLLHFLRAEDLFVDIGANPFYLKNENLIVKYGIT